MMMGKIVKHLKIPDEENTKCPIPPSGVSDTQKKVSDDDFTLSEPSEMVSEEYQNTVREEISDKKWSCKAVSKRKNRFLSDGTVLFLNFACVAVAVITTYTGQMIRVQESMYIFAMFWFMLTDPVNCFETVLANRSRCLISAGIFFFDIAIAVNSEEVWIAMASVSVLIMAAVMIGNKDWMMREIWLMTEFVERAMEKDPDNLASQSWEAHGKRETRTLLHELGITATEFMINHTIKSVYMLGHIHGHEIQDAKARRVKKLEEENLQLRIELETSDDFKTSNHYLKTEIEDLNEKISNKDILISELNQKIEKQKNQTAADRTEEETDELIRKILEAGISIRKTMQITGVTKYRVTKVKEQYGITGEDTESEE